MTTDINRIDALTLFEHINNSVPECDAIPYNPETISGLLFGVQSVELETYCYHYPPAVIVAMLEYFKADSKFITQYSALLSYHNEYESTGQIKGVMSNYTPDKYPESAEIQICNND